MMGQDPASEDEDDFERAPKPGVAKASAVEEALSGGRVEHEDVEPGIHGRYYGRY